MNQVQEVSNHYPPPVTKGARPARAVKTASKPKALPVVSDAPASSALPAVPEAATERVSRAKRVPARALKQEPEPPPAPGMVSFVETHLPATRINPADAAFGPEFEQIRQAAFEAEAASLDASSATQAEVEAKASAGAEPIAAAEAAPGSASENVSEDASDFGSESSPETASESKPRMYFHPYSSPAVVFETSKPFPVAISSPPPQNGWSFRESFREAYEDSFRDTGQQPAAEPVALPKESYKRPWRSRFYTGPEETEIAPGPTAVAVTESGAPGAIAVEPPQPAGPPWHSVLRARLAGFFSDSAARAHAGVASAKAWYRHRKVAQLSTRRMRVIETLSLGDKRFLSVVQVDDCQFLVGGGAENIAVLAQLGQQPTASEPAPRLPATEMKG